MNVLKNMEIIFTVALALACSALYAGAVGADQAAPQERVASVENRAAAPMQVVVVSARRLTEAEKKQSLLEERQASLLASAETRL